MTTGATGAITAVSQVPTEHDPATCQGATCCVHNPSDHPLRTATLYWRRGRPIARICEHAEMHPDPDDAVRRASAGLGPEWHACACRCCRPCETCQLLTAYAAQVAGREADSSRVLTLGALNLIQEDHRRTDCARARRPRREGTT